MLLCSETLYLNFYIDFLHKVQTDIYESLIDIFNFLLVAATAAVEGKMSKTLKKMLKKVASKDMHEELAVADAKLGGIIKVFEQLFKQYL